VLCHSHQFAFELASIVLLCSQLLPNRTELGPFLLKQSTLRCGRGLGDAQLLAHAAEDGAKLVGFVAATCDQLTLEHFLLVCSPQPVQILALCLELRSQCTQFSAAKREHDDKTRTKGACEQVSRWARCVRNALLCCACEQDDKTST